MGRLPPLTVAERSVLARVHEYGGGVSWGGAGASASRRNAAKALIQRGLLQGSHLNCSLTAKGLAAHKRHAAEQDKRMAAAFGRDRQEFERAPRKT